MNTIPLHDLLSPNSGNEMECRICRSSGGRLYTPCLCSGSIKYCHQDCLVAWLEHSGKTRCELCSFEFNFSPLYAPGAPTSLPTSSFLYIGLRRLLLFLPKMIRFFLVVFVWGFFMPLETAQWYNAATKGVSFFSYDFKLKTAFRKSFYLPPVPPATYANVFHDWFSGVLIITILLISALSLLNFVDFMRFQLVEEEWRERIPPNVVPVNPTVPVNNNVGVDQQRHPGQVNNPDVVPRGDNGGAGAAAGVGGEPPIAWGLNIEEIVDTDSDDEDDNPPALEEIENPGGEGQANPILQLNHIPLPQVGQMPEVREARDGPRGDLDDDDIPEVRLAQIAGIRGSYYDLIIKIVIASCFLMIIILTCIMIPHNIGRVVVQAFTKLLHAIHSESGIWFETTIAPRLLYIRGDDDYLILVSDVLSISFGYMAISSILLMGFFAVRFAYFVTKNAILFNLFRALEYFAAFMKVTVLLSIKMFVFPVSLGFLLNFCSVSLFSSSIEDRMTFAKENIFLATCLHWFAGISYMLIITVILLQLREALHPSILMHIIRAPDPDQSLISAMLLEPVSKHIRRLAGSALIYCNIILMIIYIPSHFLPEYCPSLFPLNTKVFYYWINIQLPVDLFVFHFAILYWLDTFKSHVRFFLDKWLLFTCTQLGIVSMMLPEDVSARVFNTTTVVRIPPPFFWLRIVYLLIAVWFSMFVLLIISVFLVLFTGRYVFDLLHISSSFNHDPYAMALGFVIWMKIINGIQSIRANFHLLVVERFAGVTGQLRNLPHYEIAKKVCTLIFAAVILPLSVGLLFDILYVTLYTIQIKEIYSAISLLNAYINGLLIYSFLLQVLLSRVLDNYELFRIYRTKLTAAWQIGFTLGSANDWFLNIFWPVLQWNVFLLASINIFCIICHCLILFDLSKEETGIRVFHVLVVSLMLGMPTGFLLGRYWKGIERKLLEEEYLIGRQLQNSTTTTSSTTTTNNNNNENKED